MFLERNERGNLSFLPYDFEDMLDELFILCNEDDEIYWLFEEIKNVAEKCADNRHDILLEENE